MKPCLPFTILGFIRFVDTPTQEGFTDFLILRKLGASSPPLPLCFFCPFCVAAQGRSSQDVAMIARTHIRPQPIPFAAPAQASAPAATSWMSSTPIVRRSPVIARANLNPPQVSVKFLGHGALSVQSTLTGRHYRFQGQGHLLQVDQRDVLMLGRIPDLLIG